MNYRQFGRTGWKVSEIGYGMWGLAGWTGSDEAETLQSLRRAVELGLQFFRYGMGVWGREERTDPGENLEGIQKQFRRGRSGQAFVRGDENSAEEPTMAKHANIHVG